MFRISERSRYGCYNGTYQESTDSKRLNQCKTWLLHWNRTLSCIICSLQFVRSIHMVNLKCCMVLIPLRLSPNEAKLPLEHFCGGYSRGTTTSNRYNGPNRSFLYSRDYAPSNLHLLMVIPAFLWHPLWEQRRLQEGRFQNAIKRGPKRRARFLAHRCMHPSKYSCTNWDALYWDDKPFLSRSFLLLSIKVHQSSDGV